MKNNIFFISAFFLLFFNNALSQCGAFTSFNDINTWFNDDPNSEGVAVVINGNYQGFATSTNNFEIDFDFSDEVFFMTICGQTLPIESLTPIGAFNSGLGSFCFGYFECYNPNTSYGDVAFYQPPSLFNTWLHSELEISFLNYLGVTIKIKANVTGCGLEEPELLSPLNEATNIGNTVNLEWTSVSGASEYTVVLYHDFSSIEYTTNSTSLEVMNLFNDSYYGWSVSAKNASCTGGFSYETRLFHTGIPPIPELEIDLNPTPSGEYTSSNGIRSSQPIDNGAYTHFNAQNVTLNDGFTVPQGSVFLGGQTN